MEDRQFEQRISKLEREVAEMRAEHKFFATREMLEPMRTDIALIKGSAETVTRKIDRLFDLHQRTVEEKVDGERQLLRKELENQKQSFELERKELTERTVNEWLKRRVLPVLGAIVAIGSIIGGLYAAFQHVTIRH